MLLTCAFGIMPTRSQDYFVNLETAPVQRFLSEVTYSRTSVSQVENYIDSSPYRLDQPNPLRLPLPWGMSKGLTVSFADNEDFADAKEYVVESGETEVIIYNLLPQHTYYYKIEDAFANIVSQGKVQTRGRVRMIYGPSIYNVRDMGGWETENGLRVKYGKLYRGSELNRANVASDEDVRMLLDIGIEAELDLRKFSERAQVSDGQYSALGFSLDDNTYLGTDDFGCYSYHLISSKYIKGYKAAIDYAVENLKAGRPVYVHCIYGADRSGLFAFFINGLLGVCYDHLAKDYELSSMSDKVTLHVKTRNFDSIVNYMNRFPGDALKDRIEYYLMNRVGISRENIDYLRSELLEDPNHGGNNSGIVTGMASAPATEHSHDAAVSYSLSGRRQQVKHGIKIVGGRKYLVR